MNSNLKKQHRRKMHVRASLKKTASLPRLSVYRSNKFIYAQIIDLHGKVLATAHDVKTKKDTKSVSAKVVGQTIAEAAKKAKVSKVVLDRGPYKYHGRVKQLAEGAREGGLKF